MGKKKPCRKMIIEIDIFTGQTRVIDGYKRIMETDAQTVFEKFGIEAKELLKRIRR